MQVPGSHPMQHHTGFHCGLRRPVAHHGHAPGAHRGREAVHHKLRRLHHPRPLLCHKPGGRLRALRHRLCWHCRNLRQHPRPDRVRAGEWVLQHCRTCGRICHSHQRGLPVHWHRMDIQHHVHACWWGNINIRGSAYMPAKP